MSSLNSELDKLLADADIFAPDSRKQIQQEKSLVRYLEKEYRGYLQAPVSVESYGVRTDAGPLMEQTEDLMAQHYDERIELFTGFLDTRYRAYTMAYYGEDADAEYTLEQAQYEKFRLIAQRAQIKGDESILNIGCGFGSLETFLLQEYPDIRLTGVTPSKVQVNYLQARMQDSSHPLSRNFTLLQDVFDEKLVASHGEKKYDLIMSIGVFEQLLNMRAMLELIAKLLKPGGRSFHHFITSKVATPQVQLHEKTVIGKYFPGGRIWPRDEFSRHTQYFDVADTWFVNGKNYWRTLDEWHHRYWLDIPRLYDEGFSLDALKHWNDYFSLCKVMFAPLDGDFYGNSHYLFTLK